MPFYYIRVCRRERERESGEEVEKASIATWLPAHNPEPLITQMLRPQSFLGVDSLGFGIIDLLYK